MFTLTDVQSAQINAVAPNYSIDYTDEDYAESLETNADDYVAEVTGADVKEDIGGLCVYLLGSELVAFYDYEQQVGHVF
jgi:hypothetical protein